MYVFAASNQRLADWASESVYFFFFFFHVLRGGQSKYLEGRSLDVDPRAYASATSVRACVCSGTYAIGVKGKCA